METFAYSSLLALVFVSTLGVACSSGVDADGDVDEGAVAGAHSLSEHCLAADVVSLTRPLYRDDPKAGSFAYRMRVRKPARPELPTIVHLPGGPGGTSMEGALEWVPADYGLVLTDPRGVGCNAIAEISAPDRFLTTDETASDVVAGIENLKLENYVLHGHSYGTVLATHVAHQLARESKRHPKAVVLEGVLGRSFENGEGGMGYVEAWRRHKAELPPSVLELLREEAPLGYTPKQWGNTFSVLTSQFGAKATKNVLSLLAKDDGGNRDPQKVAQFKELADSFLHANESSPDTARCQTMIACREISTEIPKDNIDIVLQNGEFVLASDLGSLCTGMSIERPYHARDLKFPFRTIYFLGEFDTATPAWQGKVHFDALDTADRVEIEVKQAGHIPLGFSLKSCAPTLLERIAAGGDVESAARACDAPVSIRSASAATSR